MEEMPFRAPAASAYAEDVDALFGTLVFLTIVFTLFVLAGMTFLVIRYRKGNRVDRSRPMTHNNILEATWSLPPLFLGLAVFLWSTKIFSSAYAPPKNAKEVFVIGKQWMWHIQHSDGIRENNELHVPVGQPVKLTMISQDVIHAFFVPEFRIQRHVEPGHYTVMWFTPTRPGKYHLYCNMYCGTQHSEMGGWVYVMPRDEYNKWTATNGNARAVAPGGYHTPTGSLSLAQQGKPLYEKYQCAGCHGSNGQGVGSNPPLRGIYGKMRQLANGQKVEADDAYLRNALFYPNEYALAGYPQSMPSYKNSISESEVLAINAYVKALSDPNKASLDAGTPDTDAPAANSGNQQWRYMYGGEQYQ
jgi:cytochrome c oxidase subunit 2